MHSTITNKGAQCLTTSRNILGVTWQLLLPHFLS
jgi:hypothetical protein